MQWVGVDAGGTFTDVVVYDERTGALDVAKCPASPADPSAGLFDTLDRRIQGVSPGDSVEIRRLTVSRVPGGLAV